MSDATLLSSPRLDGLFAALSDSAVAVRIAVARALVRLPLDGKMGEMLSSALTEFREEDIFWSTFIPDEPVHRSVLEVVQCTEQEEVELARATRAEARENARITGDESFQITALFAGLAFAVHDERSENLLADAEEVARLASDMGPSYAPDIGGLYNAYRVWLRRADRFWFDWVEKIRDQYDPATQIPPWFPLYEGPLAVSRQIEWAVSRGKISRIVDVLGPVLQNGGSLDRFAAAQLIEWSVRTKPQVSYWRFGGGAGPGDVPLDRFRSFGGRMPGGNGGSEEETSEEQSQGSFTVFRHPLKLKSFEPFGRMWYDATRSIELNIPFSSQPESENTGGERTISFWIAERENSPETPLETGVKYQGLFRVGVPVAANLFGGENVIPDSDIPMTGLNTHWKVIPTNLRLEPTDGAVITGSSGEAEFDLMIPRVGNSATVGVGLTPLGENAGLKVLIMVGERLYRELSVSLRVRGGTSASMAPGSVSVTTRDVALLPLSQANLRTTHEWTTPPGSMTLYVCGPGKATIFGSVDGVPYPPGEQIYVGTEKSELAGIVDSLRKAAESLRNKATAYLNDMDPADLLTRLKGFQPQYDWKQLQNYADAAHVAAWDTVAPMKELQVLAFYGRRLYDTLFPAEQNSRPWMDALPPGQLVRVVWRPDSGANWIPHLPWELLYRGDANPGVPIDPTQFWGLRYRIEYTSYNPSRMPSASLGTPQEACCASLLFFGKSAKELAEVQWQRQVWSVLSQKAKSCLLPAGTVSPKLEIVKALTDPESISGQPGISAAVLYLFCHYGKDPTDAPILRFGDTASADDIISEPELGTTPFASRPLVFANACATAGTGVYSANAVTKAFFDRGCRAFIGTDCMVPSAMASRFAVVFFHFFLRLADSEQAPMAAGEALAQARLFLWCQYRNIGGLFYSYLNQYDLYMASDAEIRALQRKG